MTHAELEKIISNWAETGLTETFEEKEPISLCLQSQFEFNETPQAGEAKFKRLSIPLVVRVFSESKAFKNNYFCNYFESKRPEYIFFRASLDETFSSLEEEAEAVTNLAADMTKEIDEAFFDRREAEVIFHGFGTLIDGTIFMAFN